MNECLEVLRQLSKACKDILEDMEQLGLDGEGYGDDMAEARKCITRAHKIIGTQDESRSILDGLTARGLTPGAAYLGHLDGDERARLMVAFNQCWDGNAYDPTPVDTLLAEFRARYA